MHLRQYYLKPNYISETNGSYKMKEPIIIINGVQLTDAQAMTIRVAMESFVMDLFENGLGDDKVGLELCQLYKDKISEIRIPMYKK